MTGAAALRERVRGRGSDDVAGRADGAGRLGRWTVVAVLLVLVVVRLPYFWHALLSQDEAILPLYAEQVLAGRLPHRDFYTVYGPGTFGVTALAYALLGPSLLVERVVGLGYQLLVVGGVLALGSRWGRRPAVAAALVTVVCLTPAGVAAYAWLGGIACIVWGLALVQRWERVALGAAVAVLAALFRPELVVPAVGALLPLVLGRGRLVPAALGALAGVTPSAVYYLLVGRRAFDDIVRGRLGADARPVLDRASVSVVVIAVAAVLLLVVLLWRERSGPAWSAVLLAVLVTPQVLQRPDLDHLGYQLAVVGPLVVLGAARAGHGVVPPALARAGAALLVAVVAAVGAVPLAHALTHEVRRVEVAGRSLVVTPADEAAIAATRSLVLGRVAPGARVFVGSTRMADTSLTRVQLYFLLPELRADGYWLELPVGVTPGADAGVADDVRRAGVLLLADFPADEMRALNPSVRGGSPQADAVVRARFCKVGETGLAGVYLPCGR